MNYSEIERERERKSEDKEIAAFQLSAIILLAIQIDLN